MVISTSTLISKSTRRTSCKSWSIFIPHFSRAKKFFQMRLMWGLSFIRRKCLTLAVVVSLVEQRVSIYVCRNRKSSSCPPDRTRLLYIYQTRLLRELWRKILLRQAFFFITLTGSKYSYNDVDGNMKIRRIPLNGRICYIYIKRGWSGGEVLFFY